MVNILISVAFLIIATIIQYYFFKQTQITRNIFKNIFPANLDNSLSVYKDSESNAVQIQINEDFKASPIFLDIVTSINNYLRKNKGAAEFAILKDITDRNCDALEDQIEATSPFPIYVGLCGTLIGIVLGVAVLGYGGGIDSLLSSSIDISVSEFVGEFITTDDAGATGIKDLLRGVAVAMITTFVGVVLTICGSISSKNASRDNEYRKNQFLSWMQGELLPQMNNNMVKTLDILQRNLTRFNEGFAQNSQNLNKVFANINTTYEGQAEVLRMVHNLRVDDIATANVKVLKELQKCTDKIVLLQEFINQSNQYLSSVETLNGNLKDHYSRTLLIENMAKFFMDEVQQIEVRKAAISKSVGDIDLSMQKAFEDLQKHTHDQYTSLLTATAKEHSEFLKAVEDQQQALSTKLSETSQLLEELKNLTAVKDSIAQLASQNEKLQSSHIAELQDIKSAISGMVSSNSRQNDMLERLSSAIENIDISSLSNVGLASHSGKSVGKIILIIVNILTSFTVVGTCFFFIYKSLL